MANQKQMNQMMRQVQKMQADMVAAQEALAAETVEASVGGGMVTAIVNGRLEVVKIRIDREKVDLNDYLKAHSPEELRDLLAQARRYVDYLIERMDLARLPPPNAGSVVPLSSAFLLASASARSTVR